MTDLVADDPVDAGEIRRQAEAAGLNWSTVKRAKRALGIESQKQGFDGRGMGPFEKGEPPTASAGNNSEKDGSREPVLPLDPFDGPGDPAGAWKDRDV